MPRYIDAENIERGIQDLKSSPYAMDETWTKACFAIRNAFDIVLELCVKTEPTADVEPVRHGHWIPSSDEEWYECSSCRCLWVTIDGTPQDNNMRYCPECGAKMDGGDFHNDHD